MKLWQADDGFVRCIPHILKWEGGYVNHPNDPGGETKYGISKRSYPNLDIKNLTLDQAKQIYYSNYWLASGADKLPDKKLQLIHFDSAVNHGVGQAKVFLSKLSLNPHYYIGSGLFEQYLKVRGNFYEKLVRQPRFKVFKAGWFNRLNYYKDLKF